MDGGRLIEKKKCKGGIMYDMKSDVSTEGREVEHSSPIFVATSFSKYLAMILFIALPFVGGYVGYSHAVNSITANDINKNAVMTSRVINRDATVLEQYKKGAYRVTAVVQNPYYFDESKYDSLVIVNKRANGDNDNTCGGPYFPRECYIFLESNYFGVETPEFVGVWDKGVIRMDTVKFISPTQIIFETGGGHIDVGVWQYGWEMDLTTGSTTQTFENFTADN